MKKTILFLTLLALAGCARRPVTNPRLIDGRPGALVRPVTNPASTVHVIS